MTSEEKILYDIQSPQTQRLMDLQKSRPVSEDKEWAESQRYKLIDMKAQCVKEDGSVDLNVREISQKEYDDYMALRVKRGAWFEEVRTRYLKAAAAAGKIHMSLMNHIETPHVLVKEEVKESAEKAYMGTLATIKDKFKKMMSTIFSPKLSYAEIVAEAMREAKKNEK